MRRCLKVAAIVAASTIACASPAFAQFLAGTVRDSVSRFPIPGVVVILLDSAGGTLARNLTNERGDYRVPFRDGARAARFVRIGFSPREISLSSRADAAPRLDVSILPLANLIQAVHVIANSRCRVRKDRAQALGLWEQARAGLLATIVAREENPAKVVRLGFYRVMDGNSDRIERQRVESDSAEATGKTYVAAHAAGDFMRFGFSTDSLASATFFGPDADVLLSDPFALSYCFEIADRVKSRPNQIGLHFLPSDHRKGRVDIDGTLWIDSVARALVDVEYKYLNVEAGAVRFRPGGYVSFRSVKNGVVMIDRWSIRVVSATPDTIVDIKGHLAPRDWLYAEEDGGELARAKWPDGFEWKASLGALRVRAIRSDGKPADGAVLSLVATHYYGQADARGQVDIKELLPGPYAARIIDPALAVLGVGIPTPLKFIATRDSTALATLTVPTAKEYVMGRCSAAGVKTQGGGAFGVFGRVVTLTGQPVRDAKITFATKMALPQADGTNLHWLSDYWTTGTDGLFQMCHNWDLHNQIVIRVHRFDADDIDVDAEFTANLMVVKIPVP